MNNNNSNVINVMGENITYQNDDKINFDPSGLSNGFGKTQQTPKTQHTPTVASDEDFDSVIDNLIEQNMGNGIGLQQDGHGTTTDHLQEETLQPEDISSNSFDLIQEVKNPGNPQGININQNIANQKVQQPNNVNPTPTTHHTQQQHIEPQLMDSGNSISLDNLIDVDSIVIDDNPVEVQPQPQPLNNHVQINPENNVNVNVPLQPQKYTEQEIKQLMNESVNNGLVGGTENLQPQQQQPQPQPQPQQVHNQMQQNINSINNSPHLDTQQPNVNEMASEITQNEDYKRKTNYTHDEMNELVGSISQKQLPPEQEINNNKNLYNEIENTEAPNRTKVTNEIEERGVFLNTSLNEMDEIKHELYLKQKQLQGKRDKLEKHVKLFETMVEMDEIKLVQSIKKRGTHKNEVIALSKGIKANLLFIKDMEEVIGGIDDKEIKLIESKAKIADNKIKNYKALTDKKEDENDNKQDAILSRIEESLNDPNAQNAFIEQAKKELAMDSTNIMLKDANSKI